MLLRVWGSNPDVLHAFESTPKGYEALAAGEAEPLGRENDPIQPEFSSKSIGELLLSNISTAIMHFEPPVQGTNPLVGPMSRGVMMAANYHWGHSEGLHKIVVQDPSNQERGGWMLWIPPGSGNTTFYRRCLVEDRPYPFENVPTNPEKIREYYVHSGPADEAITSFKELGFTFSDEFLSPYYNGSLLAEYERLRELSSAARGHWENPLETR